MSTASFAPPGTATPDLLGAPVDPIRKDLLADLARRLVYLGMLTLPLLYLRVGGSSGGLFLSDVIFALAAVVFMFSGARARVRRPILDGWYLGSLLMVLGGLSSAFVAVSASGTLRVVGNAIYLFFVWQWVMRSTLDTTQRRLYAITAYIFGSTISSLVAIFGRGSGLRAVGLAGQPDLMGVMNGVAVVLAIGLVFHNGWGKWNYRGVCLAILVVAVVLSASVSGMLCTVGGILLIVLRRRVRPRTILAAIAGIVLVYFVGIALLGSSASHLNLFARIKSTTTQGSGANTVSTRQETWENAWHGIEQSPIWGHGLDAYSAVTFWDPYLGESGGVGANLTATPYDTHNVILCFWYEGGILWLLGAGIALVAAARRVTGPGNRDPIRDALFVSMLVVLAYGMASPELVDRWFWLPMVLAMTYSPVAGARQTLVARSARAVDGLGRKLGRLGAFS